MAFVCKQTAVLVVGIDTMDNNTFSHFSHFILYHIPQLA